MNPTTSSSGEPRSDVTALSTPLAASGGNDPATAIHPQHSPSSHLYTLSPPPPPQYGTVKKVLHNNNNAASVPEAANYSIKKTAGGRKDEEERGKDVEPGESDAETREGVMDEEHNEPNALDDVDFSVAPPPSMPSADPKEENNGSGDRGEAFEISSQVKRLAVVVMVVLAILLTCTAPTVSANPAPWNYISALIGWVYFLAWAVSFLPQLYINLHRRSVVGQSLDFVSMNILGFACYSTYTLCFYSNHTIQEDYKARNGGKPNTVALNDVVFALWALSCCLLNGLQALRFERGGQTVSRVVRIGIAAVLCVVAAWLIVLTIFGVRTTTVFNYLDFLYGLSLVKLGVTLLKYLPQIYLNYHRKSTAGWSIENCLLDFTGGILSVVQQLIDSAVTDNWSGITGNPLKFALGLFSMLYDVVFFVQHYCLYRRHDEADGLRAEDVAVEDADDSLTTAVEVVAAAVNRAKLDGEHTS